MLRSAIVLSIAILSSTAFAAESPKTVIEMLGERSKAEAEIAGYEAQFKKNQEAFEKTAVSIEHAAKQKKIRESHGAASAKLNALNAKIADQVAKERAPTKAE